MVLFLGSLGFGALARDLGFELGLTMFITFAFYALPAQVLLVDEIARGVPILAVAFVVSLSAVRMLPMSVVIIPYLGDRGMPRWVIIPVAHMIAITAWIESMRRLPQLPEHLRLAHFIGIATVCGSSTLLGTAVGYLLAGVLPVAVAAGFLFVTPLYFMLSMIATARVEADWLAIIAGALLGPPLFVIVPGFELLIAGLAGGTLAYVIGRRR